MALEWHRWCKSAGLSVEENEIILVFPDDRGHRVRVDEGAEEIHLVGMVAKKSVTENLEQVALRLWERNRTTQLVGFRLDERQRILGEAWVPKAGLSAEEFVMYVRSVGAACDRLEYLLTGSDRE